MSAISRLALALFLVACASDDRQDPAPAPTETSRPAPSTPAPAPSNGSPSPGGTTTPAPLVAGDLENCGEAKEIDVPSGGASFVVNVDTRQMRRAHLGAGARALVAEDPASFVLDLAEQGSVIQEGWDVCVGQTDTSCFANLEMDPGIGVRTFTLAVRPKSASTASRARVSFCVIDPLE